MSSEEERSLERNSPGSSRSGSIEKSNGESKWRENSRASSVDYDKIKKELENKKHNLSEDENGKDPKEKSDNEAPDELSPTNNGTRNDLRSVTRSRSRESKKRRVSQSRSRSRSRSLSSARKFRRRSRSPRRSRSRSRRRSQSPKRRSRSPRRRRSRSRGRRSRSRSVTPADGARLHVAELDVETRKRDLEKLFEKYGTLREIWMARNPPCFAFVVFNRQKDADRALRESDGKQLGHCRIKVTQARPRVRGGRFRGGYDPNLRCYQCGELGHFSRNCTDTKFGYKRPSTPPGGRNRGERERVPSRRRSRSRSRGRRSRS